MAAGTNPRADPGSAPRGRGPAQPAKSPARPPGQSPPDMGRGRARPNCQGRACRARGPALGRPGTSLHGALPRTDAVGFWPCRGKRARRKPPGAPPRTDAVGFRGGRGADGLARNASPGGGR